VTSGSGPTLTDLPPAALEILEAARRGVLATIGEDGMPHVVPVVFAVVDGRIFSPIDDKPKSGRELARVKNIRSRDKAAFLVDRWSEDWLRLGWVMMRGNAVIEEPGWVTQTFLDRYPQYEAMGFSSGERAIALSPTIVSWWLWSS
jgi:PPOX class probable F420-dependent enzyme